MPETGATQAPSVQLCSPRTMYRHNPYSSEKPFLVQALTPTGAAACAVAAPPVAGPPVGTDRPAVATPPPHGRLHAALRGEVCFVPFPPDAFDTDVGSASSSSSSSQRVSLRLDRPPLPPPPVDCSMTRVFIGQLPYDLPPARLEWICAEFGGQAIARVEHITAYVPQRRAKVATGCINGYVPTEGMEDFLARLHKRVLVDSDGVWFARDEDETASLAKYCAEMQNDWRRRFPNRPSGALVAQPATSTFQQKRENRPPRDRS